MTSASAIQIPSSQDVGLNAKLRRSVSRRYRLGSTLGRSPIREPADSNPIATRPNSRRSTQRIEPAAGTTGDLLSRAMDQAGYPSSAQSSRSNAGDESGNRKSLRPIFVEAFSAIPLAMTGWRRSAQISHGASTA